MMFAVITAALISGGTTDRIKFPAFVLFIASGSSSSTSRSPTGSSARRAGWPIGASSTSPAGRWSRSTPDSRRWRSCWCSGDDVDGRARAMAPHSVPLSLLGVGILWFGWFGFNAGSALGMNGVAVYAFVNTAAGRCGRPARLAVLRTGPRGLPDDAWAPPPVRWPAWWRSRPCAGFVTPMASLAHRRASPASSAPWPCG